jgi:hypothetical protein
MPKRRRKSTLKRLLYPLAGILLACGFVVAYLYFNDEPIPIIRKEQGVAPETLGGIGPEGKGGDARLNVQKNRTAFPKVYEDLTIQQLIAIDHDLLEQQGKRRREKWYPSARLYAEQQEARGIRLEGYLLRAKQSGIESANGYIDSLRDYHLWIGDGPNALRNTTVIAEVTPRWKIVYPEWRLRTFRRLAEQKARVRVSGWLLWDQEHASEVAKSRGTQWEIHPMTRFEVWNNGQWIELGQMPHEDGVPNL